MPDSPTRRTRPVARHKWIELRADADDEPYLTASPGVLVVPLNYAGDVLFAHEGPHQGPGLALPGGLLDAEEDPLHAAKRILQADTGFSAEVWFPLGVIAPLGRRGQWDVHLFLARNLVPARSMAAAIYQGAPARLPLDGVEAAIASGRLHDATAIAALYLARQFIAGALRVHPPDQAGGDNG